MPSTITTLSHCGKIVSPLPAMSFDHPLDNDLHLARIAFQAADFAYDDTPVNVTLVLDASGSMSSGNRVAIAREAAESIRRSLRGQDRIAVIHFTTRVLNQYTVEHRDPDDSDVTWSISQACAARLHECASRPGSWRTTCRSHPARAPRLLQLRYSHVGRCGECGCHGSLRDFRVGGGPRQHQPAAPNHHRCGH